MASLISLRSLAPSFSLLFFLFSFAEDGRGLYLKHCATCHHEERIGRTAPPLLPEFLRRYSDIRIRDLIKKGIPASNMPSFSSLTEGEIKEIIRYIRSPAHGIRYTLEEVKRSRIEFKNPRKRLPIKDIRNLIVVVDKGAKEVWIAEGKRIFDRFILSNVHGGVKFSPDGRDFYVPSRDGWVAHYSVEEGRLKEKVRACVYLRNIALFRNLLAVSCVLPKSLILMDRNLRPLKRIELEGRPSAVYELRSKGGFILTFRDRPLVGFVNEEGKISYRRIEAPLEDFFIDPFERFLIGSSRKGKKLIVYRLDTLKKVFERKVPGLPHLFSASFWYSGGNFYFATRHIGSTKVSVWRMYDWKLIKEIDTGGKGFFVRTTSRIPHLWIDNGDGSFVLLDKKTLEVKRLKVSEKGRAIHVEFSPDGRFAYVSVIGEGRGLYIYDPLTLRLLKKIPAKHPAGKYNFVNKTRSFLPAQLGYEVFMERCWGCHHPTRTAFGPSLRWIAKHRSREEIISQLVDPEDTSKLLGYERNAMPRIDLSQEEINALLSYIESLKGEGYAKAD